MDPPAAIVDRCWTVPFVAACSTFLFAIPHTNSGLFYIFFMDKFGITREIASWPKTVVWAITPFMGFTIAAVQDKVSLPNMILASAVLCPAAVMASAFVPNMAWMIVTLGVFYGLAFGILLVATSIYIVTYFNEYRCVAAGINFLGGSLTGIVGPSLLLQCVSAYGLQGALLITGALMLNLIPLALILREPRPCTWQLCLPRRKSKQAKRTDTSQRASSTPADNTDAHQTLIRDPKLPCRNEQLSDVQSKGPEKVARNETALIEAEPLVQSVVVTSVSEGVGLLEQFRKTLVTPAFYVLSVAMIALDFTFPFLGSTIIDYGSDKGVALGDATQLVIWLCLGGFCGFLVVSTLSDKVVRSRCCMGSLSFALLAIFFLVIPHVSGLTALSAVTFAAGVQLGYISTLKPVLVADYLGVHSMGMSWGLMGLASLPVAFCEPAILGAFRDKGGSYDNLYRACAAVALFAALVLLLQACFDAKKKNKVIESASPEEKRNQQKVYCKVRNTATMREFC